VKNPHNTDGSTMRGQVLLDGIPLNGSLIPLVDDGQPHEVYVLMAKKV